MKSDEAANDAPAPAAGSAKATSFADRVRVGEHLERVRKHGVELGTLKARALDLAADLQRAIAENDGIAEALEKDRSGR
jgi:hypothetical protein